MHTVVPHHVWEFKEEVWDPLLLQWSEEKILSRCCGWSRCVLKQQYWLKADQNPVCCTVFYPPEPAGVVQRCSHFTRFQLSNYPRSVWVCWLIIPVLDSVLLFSDIGLFLSAAGGVWSLLKTVFPRSDGSSLKLIFIEVNCPQWLYLKTGNQSKIFYRLKSVECEFRSILGCSHWVQFYLCGFPRLLARYWPLTYLFDGWLYDTILVQSVTEGQASPAPGMWPFSGYVLSGKDASAWEFNESKRSC